MSGKLCKCKEFFFIKGKDIMAFLFSMAEQYFFYIPSQLCSEIVFTVNIR